MIRSGRLLPSKSQTLEPLTGRTAVRHTRSLCGLVTLTCTRRVLWLAYDPRTRHYISLRSLGLASTGSTIMTWILECYFRIQPVRVSFMPSIFPFSTAPLVHFISCRDLSVSPALLLYPTKPIGVFSVQTVERTNGPVGPSSNTTRANPDMVP